MITELSGGSVRWTVTNSLYHLALRNAVYDFMNKPVKRQKGNKNKNKQKRLLYNAPLVFVTTGLAFSKPILEVETPVCLFHACYTGPVIMQHTQASIHTKQDVGDCVFHK